MLQTAYFKRDEPVIDKHRLDLHRVATDTAVFDHALLFHRRIGNDGKKMTLLYGYLYRLKISALEGLLVNFESMVSHLAGVILINYPYLEISSQSYSKMQLTFIKLLNTNRISNVLTNVYRIRKKVLSI